MNEYILRLDITMYDVMGVHKGHSPADLFEVLLDFVLWQADVLLEVAEEVAAGAVLHHEVDAVLVVEERVEADDVGVLEVALDLYFADEVAGVSSEDAFGYLLERAEEVGGEVPGLVRGYLARWTSPNWPY